MSDRGPIRVLIVDDHALVRTGLGAFLQVYDDLELVGEAESGEDALRLCARLEPDVVLMDLVLPGMDGATATQAIRARWPQTQVVALTSFKDQEWVERALQAGAVGYLLKNVSAEELAHAARAAYAGQATLAPEATQALVQAMQRAGEPSRPDPDLTAREREVLSPEVVEALMDTAADHAAEADERLVHLRRCVESLGKAARRMLRLRYWRMLRVEQIAEHLGKTRAAIEMALVRARRRLRACVERKLAKARGGAS